MRRCCCCTRELRSREEAHIRGRHVSEDEFQDQSVRVKCSDCDYEEYLGTYGGM